MSRVIFQHTGDGIGQITLNDPDNLNAMGEEMALEFRSVVSQISSQQRGVRVLVLTGAGRAFSAGGNLEMLEAKTRLSAEENRRRMLAFYDSFLGVLKLNIPIIAAINGHAIGAGLCVAAACDVRIAASGTKLGFTFTRLGLHPGMGATYFLSRVVGHAKAAELLLTARVIDAEEALKIGLVSQVTASSELVARAQGIAAEILECGPMAVQQLLESIRTPPSSLTAALEREATCQSLNYAGAEFKEGIAATREKRKAKFQ